MTENNLDSICTICGIPKTHYRLYGYRCSNPEHHEMESEIKMQNAKNWLDSLKDRDLSGYDEIFVDYQGKRGKKIKPNDKEVNNE